jgi:hypothetical protein
LAPRGRINPTATRIGSGGAQPMFSNIPLLLTWLRIVLIPVFVAVFSGRS